MEESGEPLQDDDAEQANHGSKIKRVYIREDYVETEVKLLHNDDYIQLLVRPFKKDSTKVTMWKAGDKVRQETVLENKSY